MDTSFCKNIVIQYAQTFQYVGLSCLRLVATFGQIRKGGCLLQSWPKVLAMIDILWFAKFAASVFVDYFATCFCDIQKKTKTMISIYVLKVFIGKIMGVSIYNV